MNQFKRLYFQFTGSIFLLIALFIGYIVKFYPHNHFLVNFDTTFINLIRQFNPYLTHFFKAITCLGEPKIMALITAIFVLIFLYKKDYLEATYLSINMILIAGAGNQLLKLLFQRVRPDSANHLVQASGYSFPSGHSMGSVLLYATLALLGLYLFKNNKLLKVLSSLLLIMPFLIGCSRIYLGVHYPSDVLAGWLFSFAWLCLTYPIYCKRRFIKNFTRR